MAKLPNYLREFPEDLMLFGLEDIIKKLHESHRLQIMKLIDKKIHISTYYYWLNGKTPIPLEFLKLFNAVDPKIIDYAYERFTFVSFKRKKHLLPKIIDEKLSYLIGVLHGDGSLDKTGKYVTVTCESREYLDTVLKKMIFDLFDYVGNIFDMDKGKYYRLVIGSRAINSFFSIFCPVGNKKGKIRIPGIILKDKKLLISYFSGLFDTDGSLPHVEERKIKPFFVFVQADRRFVEDVSRALEEIGINNKVHKFMSPSKPGEIDRNLEEWKIYIGSKKILKDFLIKVPFFHPLKRKRREILLKTL